MEFFTFVYCGCDFVVKLDKFVGELKNFVSHLSGKDKK